MLIKKLSLAVNVGKYVGTLTSSKINIFTYANPENIIFYDFTYRYLDGATESIPALNQCDR